MQIDFVRGEGLAAGGIPSVERAREAGLRLTAIRTREIARTRLRALVIVLGSYLALATVMTWPLVARLGTAAPGVGEDTPLFLWNVWWIREAIAHAAGPLYWTDQLFYPSGTSLALHGLTALPGVLTLPVNVLASPVAALGSIVLLNCVLNAACAYRLVHRLTGDASASWIAGLMFAYSPWALGELQNHYNLYTLWPFVLFVDGLLRTLESPGRWGTLQLSIAIPLMIYTDLQFPVLAIIPAVVALFFCFRRRHDIDSWSIIRAGSIGLLIGGALSFPLLLPAVKDLAASPALSYVTRLGEQLFYSADITAFLQPHLLRTGGLPERFLEPSIHAPRRLASQFVQLGYMPMLLGFLGVLAGLGRRFSLPGRLGPGFWLGLFAFGILLTLGPILVVDGKLPKIGSWPGIPIPTGWLMAWIPIINVERVPTRHMVSVTLALAVFGGIAIAWLNSRWKTQWRKLSVVAIGMLLAFELLPAPLPLESYVPDPAFALLTEHGAVIDVPFSAQEGHTGVGIYANAIRAMGEQALHGRPIAGGYVSRAPESSLSSIVRDPFFRYLGGCEPEPPSVEVIRVALERTNARYVMLHRDWLLQGSVPKGCTDSPSIPEVEALLVQIGMGKLTETPTLAIYELR